MAPDEFSAGRISAILLEAHNMVDTAFVHVPIMSNGANSVSQHMQSYIDGNIERFADILALWEKDTIDTMKEFGYDNVIAGELP